MLKVNWSSNVRTLQEICLLLLLLLLFRKTSLLKVHRSSKRVNTTRNMLVVFVVVVAEKDIFAKSARVLKRGTMKQHIAL